MLDFIIFLIASAMLMVGYGENFLASPLALFSHLFLAASVCLHGFYIKKYAENSVSDASLYSFNLLFLLVAPALQLSFNNNRLVNTMNFDGGLIFRANIAAAVLMFSYLFFSYNFRINSPPNVVKVKSFDFVDSWWLFFVIFLILPFAYIRFKSAVSDRFFNDAEIEFNPIDMVVNKFFMFLPVPALIYCTARIRFDRGIFVVLLTIISLIGVFLTQNSFLEKRNGLGPVYLTIIFIVIGGGFSFVKGLRYVLSGVVAIFLPLVAIFTHAKVDSISDVSESLYDLILDHFLDIHYDAWANIVAVVELVGVKGYYMGTQLLGSLLFATPRFIWPDKPLASGTEIGLFLSDYHAMWFTNLSAPFVAEFYFDFGLIGCILGGWVLFLFVNSVNSCIYFSENFLLRLAAFYFSFYLVFVLRGSLMVAIAYGFGNFLAFIFVNFMANIGNKSAMHASK